MISSRLLTAVVLVASISTCVDGADNVDTNASDKDRVKHMHQLVRHAVDQLDATATEAGRKNTALFLMRVAWHEGAFFKHRRQVGGGPGRSFFQFEAGRAKEAVDYAVLKKIVDELATSGGTTTKRLTEASNALALGRPWPSGNLVEELLGDDDKCVDLFACYMTRIVLKKIPASIPTDADGHAKYWADHWKKVFIPPTSRPEKIKQFKEHAAKLDALLQ